MSYEELTEMDADDVEKVWINSSNVSVYTEDNVFRVRGMLRGPRDQYQFVTVNGAQIHTRPTTHDPAIEVTTVKSFDYHELKHEGEYEEQQLRVEGRGEIR